jgi:hypothetical protein
MTMGPNVSFVDQYHGARRFHRVTACAGKHIGERKIG